MSGAFVLSGLGGPSGEFVLFGLAAILWSPQDGDTVTWTPQDGEDGIWSVEDGDDVTWTVVS
jgi:hypothetical protein